MMIGDSVTEPHIIANDSGLCVYSCVQLHNPAQIGIVLPWITTTVIHITDTRLILTVFCLHSLWIVINGVIMEHIPGTVLLFI